MMNMLDFLSWRLSQKALFLINAKMKKINRTIRFIVSVHWIIDGFQKQKLLLTTHSVLCQFLFFSFQQVLINSVGSYRIRLKIVGNGYYILVPKETHVVLYRGTSHLFNFPLPQQVRAVISGRKKRLLTVYSTNKLELMNFANFMYNYAKPDVYRGKGLRFVKQKLRLKEGKKKFV